MEREKIFWKLVMCLFLKALVVVVYLVAEKVTSCVTALQIINFFWSFRYFLSRQFPSKEFLDATNKYILGVDLEYCWGSQQNGLCEKLLCYPILSQKMTYSLLWSTSEARNIITLGFVYVCVQSSILLIYIVLFIIEMRVLLST